MNATEFLWAIGRATAFTSASVLVALALVTLLRVRSPRLHRAAWFLAIMPSWLLVSWTWRLEAPPAVIPTEALRDEVRTEVTVSPTASAIAMPVANSQATANPARPLLVIYLGGMTSFLGVGFARYLRFVRRLPRSEEPLEPDWQHEWQRQLRAVRTRRPIELRVTLELGPLLCFVPFQYLLLVPRPLWKALARPQRTAILRHELAHWRRGDLWWSFAIRALALPQWFNPLAWLAIRRFDEAGEWACDDLVARGRRSHELAFARSLLAAADFATTNTPGTAAVQGGELARRVRRLVSHRFKEETKMKKFLVLVPLAAIVVAQTIRIERVTAEEPVPAAPQPSSLPDTSTDTTIQRPDAILPPYVIEPPDVLRITPIRLSLKPPRRIQCFETILVKSIGVPAEQKIPDGFEVDADGRINLGPPYGRIQVEGLTVDEAEAALERKLNEFCDQPEVGVSFLVAGSNYKIVAGEYLVGPDGRINLGAHGTLYVAGMAIDEARREIEDRLAESFDAPQIALDVDQYNSKKYYVITRNSNKGDNIVTAPITGNDTVLDALALVDDALKQSTTKIWISRPTGRGTLTHQILPVNWDQIVDGTSTATNYQLLAGDRLFVVNEINDERDQVKATPTAAKSKTISLRSVEFQIEIIEDRAGALKEYADKRGDTPMTLVDTATIGPAMRILSKHGLIKTLSAPKITCQMGKSAQMIANETDNKPSPNPLQLHLAARETEIGIVTELHLKGAHVGPPSGIDYGAQLKPGQTLLVAATEEPSTPDQQQPKATYLAIRQKLLPETVTGKITAEHPVHTSPATRKE